MNHNCVLLCVHVSTLNILLYYLIIITVCTVSTLNKLISISIIYILNISNMSTSASSVQAGVKREWGRATYIVPKETAQLK